VGNSHWQTSDHLSIALRGSGQTLALSIGRWEEVPPESGDPNLKNVLWIKKTEQYIMTRVVIVLLIYHNHKPIDFNNRNWIFSRIVLITAPRHKMALHSIVVYHLWLLPFYLCMPPTSQARPLNVVVVSCNLSSLWIWFLNSRMCTVYRKFEHTCPFFQTSPVEVVLRLMSSLLLWTHGYT
jgi:hypothetical protein